jgi:FkbM family methyltransferase
MEYYSQIGQDKKVIEFYKSKKNGYFVEIGAYDGIALSNTYALEKHLDWTGICVEPLKQRFEQLVKNRTAICSNLAVYHSSDLDVSFDIEADSGMLSGINTHIDAHKHVVNRNKKTVTVRTISLNDLLEKNKAPAFMEYLSLDTEGSEYEILRTLDFNKWAFGIIDLEHNNIEPRRTQIRHLLTQNGYLYAGPNKWDDQYIHRSLITTKL